MKIEVVRSTSMQLAHASESVIKSIGLCSVAWYKPTEWEGFLYKITFYNRHAPVNVSVDLISVSLDCPHVQLNVTGDIVRDDRGRIAITNRFLFACPKTSSGTYMMGFNPKEMAQRYINNYLVPTYAGDDYFVKLIK